MTGWPADALCQQVDPDLFFPPEFNSRQQVVDAQTICAACPVRVDCLEAALEQGEEHGIWGGLTPRDRLRLLRLRARSVA